MRFFFVCVHILHTWNMDYKFPELSNDPCPGQETTPLGDVQIRIMPRVSQSACDCANFSDCWGSSVNC